MAALNFPNSPSLNDTHTENGVTFKWNGAAWDRLGDIGAQGSAGAAGAQGATGSTGAQGATGPVAGSSTQVVYKDGSNNPAGSANFTFDGTNLTVSGNVSIGGTLTYEDVTNIDSVGLITARAGVKVPDSQRIFVGTDDDLQIYHDGTINRIRSDVLTVIEKNDSEDMASFRPDGAVVLFYNGTQKFETTSAGIKVSGSFPDITIHDTDTTNDNLRILHNGGGTQLQVDPNNVGPNASHFIVGIDGTERLRITSAGNMGVGNVNPTQARLVAQTTSGSSLAAIKDNTGASIVFGGVTQPRALLESGASASDFRIYTAGGNSYGSASWVERLRVTSAGELYIGSTTANGQGKLFVNDSSGATTTRVHIRNAVSTGTAETYYNLDSSKFASVGLENGDLVFKNSSSSTPTERLRINASGTLIVATGGNLQMASNGRIFVGNGGNATNPMFANVSDTNTGIAFPSADTMMFTTGGAEGLRIDSDRNVIIGAKDFHNHNGTVDSLQIGYALNLYEDSYTSGTDNYAIWANNAYYAGSGGNKYMRNDEASRIYQHSGEIVFETAAAGTADNAITFNDRLRITQAGGYVLKSYGRAIRYYTTTLNYSMYRTVVAISMTGNSAYEIRFTGSGNGFTHAKCMASHWTSNYDLIRESYLAHDSYSGLSVHDQFNKTSGTQGAWTFSRPGSGSTGYQSHFVINKSAGSYGGGMVGCIVLESDRPYELLSIT